MTLNIKQLDRLAEHTGCKEHDDCLTCPLTECIYDHEPERSEDGEKCSSSN